MKKLFNQLLFIVVLLTSMNFFVSGQSYLDTISSVKLENRSDVFQIYESWIFSTYTNNFDPIDLGGSALVRGMDTWNGQIYFPFRALNGKHKIYVYNGSSGIRVGAINLQKDIFTKIENGDTINAVTLPNNDLHFDSVGNCLIGGCVISTDEEMQSMLIYKVNLETGGCDEIINEPIMDNVRFDAFDVYGDINNDAIIMTVDNNLLYCYRWTINNGVVGNAEKILLPKLSGPSWNSVLSARMYIVNDSVFYVDGHGSYANRYKYTEYGVEYLDNSENTPDVGVDHSSLAGCTEFQLKDKNGKEQYFFISAKTNGDDGGYTYYYDLIQFADENKNFAEATYLCSFPENTSAKNNNTYRTAEVSVEVVGNVANIYWYIGENGFGKYTFFNDCTPNLIVNPNNEEYGYTIGGGFYDDGENITIQAFNYSGYVFSHWSDLVKENPRTITISGDSTIRITAIFQEDTIETKLDGVFSVAKDKQIVFSPGNLQYKSTIKAWRFAENQYDIIGNANINISALCYNWIDLFGWGTSGYNNTYPENMRSDNSVDYGNGNSDIANTNYDWGVFNAIINGGNKPNMWRTLTTAEWRYIIGGRPNASSLYGIACINGINGAILLPDNWKSIENISFTCYDSINKITNNYTLEQWYVLENSGAVFLPLAGLRNEADGFLYGNNIGVYWSSSYQDYRTAYGLYIDTINIYPDYYNFRDIGRSVRLVKDTITTYNIVLNIDNEKMGTVVGSGTYDYGTEVTIEAIANVGYLFVQWSDGNTENPRTIVVTEDVELQAEFKEDGKTFVDNVDGSSVMIYVQDGVLYVEGAETDYYVLDAAGRLIYTGRVAELSLPRGVYVVNVGGEVEKVVI